MFFASTSGFARLLCRRCCGVARTDDSLTLGAAAAEDGDLHALLQILPHDVRDNLLYESNLHQLLEAVPRKREVSTEELEYESWEETIELELWALCIGYLQSGIRMGIIGLTCRVGRPHRENLDMVRDLLEYAQRGVMLIGSAHGKWLEDIIKKPTLSDLIGGLETVILSDQEARSRNCKKSILERRAAPTFPFLIEMRERHYWVAHQTDKNVDELLRGRKPLVEVRRRDKQFKVVIERWKIDE